MSDTLPDPGLRDLLDRHGLTAGTVGDLLATVRQAMVDEVASVVDERESGGDPIPIVAFADVERGTVPERTRDAIRRRGCAVVRSTLEPGQAEQWDRRLGEYLGVNRFEERWAARDPERAAGGSRIMGIYWSKPQVQARQHAHLTTVRRFLNGFWHHDRGVAGMDPDDDVGYPDRVRRREPGAGSIGLPPHVDSPSTRGWRHPENLRVGAAVLGGRPDEYDPWDATERTVDDVGPAGASSLSSVFRTFQGWTALSEMRPDDGVLHLVPVPAVAAYTLLTGIAGELGIGVDAPTPTPRRTTADEVLLPALTPIPDVEPGDTVWWHGDVIHAVADAANLDRWGNVMYIGAAPRCERNDRYAASMLERFERGASPVDFPPEDFEVDFVGRAGVADLDATGRRQFGLDPLPTAP